MIKKLAVPLSLAVAATLAACAGANHETVVTGSAATGYVASATAVPTGGAVYPGAGKVTLLTDFNGPVADISSQRVTMKMKDGATQVFDVHGEQLTMGEYIVIRSDNRIEREPRN